jgi:hypothetical protein
MKPGGALYLTVGIGLAVQAFFAYFIGGSAMSERPGQFWFIVPHLLLLPISIAAVAFDARLTRRATFWVVVVCLACLIPTFYFDIDKWHALGDGPGMAWIFMVGSTSLINTGIGIPMIYFAHKRRRSNTSSATRDSATLGA